MKGKKKKNKLWAMPEQMWEIKVKKKKKNMPSNAGDMGSIPGHGTNIPHASEQQNEHKTKNEHSK